MFCVNSMMMRCSRWWKLLMTHIPMNQSICNLLMVLTWHCIDFRALICRRLLVLHSDMMIVMAALLVVQDLPAFGLDGWWFARRAAKVVLRWGGGRYFWAEIHCRCGIWSIMWVRCSRLRSDNSSRRPRLHHIAKLHGWYFWHLVNTQ